MHIPPIIITFLSLGNYILYIKYNKKYIYLIICEVSPRPSVTVMFVQVVLLIAAYSLHAKTLVLYNFIAFLLLLS